MKIQFIVFFSDNVWFNTPERPLPYGRYFTCQNYQSLNSPGHRVSCIMLQRSETKKFQKVFVFRPKTSHLDTTLPWWIYYIIISRKKNIQDFKIYDTRTFRLSLNGWARLEFPKNRLLIVFGLKFT